MKTKRYRVVLKQRTGNIYFINIDPNQSEDFMMYEGLRNSINLEKIYTLDELVVCGAFARIKGAPMLDTNSIEQFAKWAGF